MATTKPNQLSNNNYLIVLVLVSLLVLGGTGLGAKTLITGIIRDTKVLTAKGKASTQLTQNLDAAPQLVDRYKALGPKQKLITDALPNTTDLPGLIALLENLSASNGSNLKSVSPSLTAVSAAAPAATGTAATTTGAAATTTGTGVQPPAPQPYNVSLAFDGTYASLLKLLGAMEQSARPMRVTSIQFSGSGGNLSAQLEATTYYQDKATLPVGEETVK
jgi:hypothetical protein